VHESGREIKNPSFESLIERYLEKGDILCYDYAVKINTKDSSLFDKSELDDSVNNYSLILETN